MVRAYTWEQLGRATLRRQFPRVRGRGPAAVAELVRRVGPIQSQAARAPFLAVSSRLPGASYDAINAAYESLELVRGTTMRGTVHTCVRDQHAVSDAVSRVTLEGLWRRTLKLEKMSVEDVRAETERFGTGAWQTPDALRANLTRWLSAHETPAAVSAAQSQAGRFMAIGHSGLVRRPLAGGWDRQTTPGYRSAAEVLGESRAGVVADPAGGLEQLVRVHLGAFGPATRADVAWWSGAGLRQVDTALAGLGEELTSRPGPDGLTYYDVTDPPPAGWSDPGVRLLPEFDALLLGYAPSARRRFVEPRHLASHFTPDNGMFAPAVLADGRLRARWRLVGSGDSCEIEVTMLPGESRLDESDLSNQAAAVSAALGIEIADVRVAATPD
ncbi:MAG: DNA glycosylase AlkZ-like family protein [Nocardioidaceae bacterium]